MSHTDPLAPFVGTLTADRFKVSVLLQLAREGRLRIPPFQRPLRWKLEHKLELFDSLYHRYPIGTLLLWSRNAPAETVTFGGATFSAPERSDALWIVDGQQRLNTIVSAMLHPRAVQSDRTRGSEIAFDLVDGRFVSCRGHVSPTLVPLNRLADPVDTAQWARERGVSDETHRLAQQVSAAIVNYEVPAYTTSAQDDAVLRKVFTRANTAGISMRPEEVFNALNTPLTGDKSILTPLEQVVSGVQFGTLDAATLMKSLIAVSDVSPRSGRPNLDAFDAASPHVGRAADALARAIELLRDDARIPHARMLPGKLAIVVLTHFLHRFPTPHERTVELLVRWVWRSAIHDRLSLTNEHLHRSFRIVQHGDEHGVVQALLRQLPSSAPVSWPESHVFNPSGRTTQMELCALAALGPRKPDTDGTWSVTDPADLFDGDDAPGPLRLRTGDPKLDRLTATRMFAPPSLLAHLHDAPDEVLHSHALAAGEVPGPGGLLAPEVILRRADRLRTHVGTFLRGLARWGEDGDIPAFDVAFADEADAA